MPKVKELKTIDVFEVLKGYSFSSVYKGRLKESVADCDKDWVWFNWTNREKPVKVKRFIEVGSNEFEALCRLLAAYAAEGSSSTPETTKSRLGASISSSNIAWLMQMQKDYHLLFSDAKSCILRSNKGVRRLEYSTGKGRKTIFYEDKTCKLQMMNQLAAVFFKCFCGQKSIGKKLPFFIFHAPKHFQKLFLDVLVEGDGSHSVNKRLGYSKQYIEKNFKYTTNSLELASGLSFLFGQLGLNYHLNYRNSKKAYTLGTSTKHNSRVATKVLEEAYSGYVYDLSVEGSHLFVDACGQILVHNTDSIFLVHEKGNEQKVLDFQKGINASLPGRMELELEDFYPRGIFVGKKIAGKAAVGEGGEKGEAGAKKKYALINKQGKIKIRGFELVRRDWSKIARATQKEVLRVLLEEGDVQKAVGVVRGAIERLNSGKVPLEDVVIMTQLQKKTGSYEIVSPEVSAALKARKAGINVPEGAVMQFVITKQGKTISEKAQVLELAKDYDAEYYVNNQIVPTVLKILGAFGIDAEQLKTGKAQRSLGDW